MTDQLVTVSGPPAFEPDHPGAILREEFLEPHRLEVSAAAERLGVTRQTVHRILAGTSSVTADMALRLGKLTGTSPAFWLNLQSTYDLWHQQRALGKALDLIERMGDPPPGTSRQIIVGPKLGGAGTVVGVAERGPLQRPPRPRAKTHASTARLYGKSPTAAAKKPRR
jgi:addiction module HigA family antidote